jgi:hypothetical protein
MSYFVRGARSGSSRLAPPLRRRAFDRDCRPHEPLSRTSKSQVSHGDRFRVTRYISPIIGLPNRWCPEESHNSLAKTVACVKSGTNAALDIPLLFASVSHLNAPPLPSADFTDGDSNGYPDEKKIGTRTSRTGTVVGFEPADALHLEFSILSLPSPEDPFGNVARGESSSFQGN